MNPIRVTKLAQKVMLLKIYQLKVNKAPAEWVVITSDQIEMGLSGVSRHRLESKKLRNTH